MEVATAMLLAGGMNAAGGIMGGLGSSTGGYDLMPPALGWNARKQYMGQTAGQLNKLAMDGGGFGQDFMQQAFQQSRSMMAPAMRDAQRSLNFAQMSKGIYDSGAGLQQQGGLQNAFLGALTRNSLDITLKNEMQRRQEMMQGLGMMMQGITPGGAVQTPGGQSSMGVVGQQGLGGMGDAMAMYGLSNMFQGGGNTQQIQPGYGQGATQGAMAGAQYGAGY